MFYGSDVKEKKDIIAFIGFESGYCHSLIAKGQFFDKWILSWI
tara:strand:- start:897 stop:1025 length:129 start_codon:yes stop_codon:yes gene_type:complete